MSAADAKRRRLEDARRRDYECWLDRTEAVTERHCGGGRQINRAKGKGISHATL